MHQKQILKQSLVNQLRRQTKKLMESKTECMIYAMQIQTH